MDDFKEILTAEFLSISGGLFAGLMLVGFTKQLSLIPGLFILIPGFLEMRGSLGGTLSSRISSGLFLGVIKPKMNDNIIKSNIIGHVILILICSLILGIFAYISSSYFFGIENIKLIYISIISGVISLLMTPITIYTTLFVFKKGHDPNNIMGPYITTIGDITSIVSFSIAIWAVA